MFFFKAALFFGIGVRYRKKKTELKAADTVNISHQSPENASQTDVPQGALSPFISIRGVLAALWFGGGCQISSTSSCQYTLENVEFYL